MHSTWGSNCGTANSDCRNPATAVTQLITAVMKKCVRVPPVLWPGTGVAHNYISSYVVIVCGVVGIAGESIDRSIIFEFQLFILYLFFGTSLTVQSSSWLLWDLIEEKRD